MNILVLNPILFSGNQNSIPKVSSIKDTMIYNMCLAFVELGHNVTLLAIDDYRPTQTENYDFEILFFKNDCSKFLPAALPCSFEIYKYIKKNSARFEMILSSEVFAFHSLFAAMIAPEKTVIWQELVAHQRKLKTIPSRIWHSVVVPLFFRKIRIVVGRSERAIEFISKYMKNVSDEFIDHGINISKFFPSETKKRQFISTAQLIPRKQINTIIDIFYTFVQSEKYADFKLLLVGRGSLEDQLLEQVRRMNLEKNVEFCGFLSHHDLNLLLSESYASLLNTNNDLNTVSISEAIVSGTPVVTNKVPALADFVKNNDLGIAKNNWNKADLTLIVENSDYYTSNCLKMRHLMSSRSAASRIIQQFYANEDIK